MIYYTRSMVKKYFIIVEPVKKFRTGTTKNKNLIKKRKFSFIFPRNMISGFYNINFF
jgi:hypothetical protein